VCVCVCSPSLLARSRDMLVFAPTDYWTCILQNCSIKLSILISLCGAESRLGMSPGGNAEEGRESESLRV
jgi:hypothetical protein